MTGFPDDVDDGQISSDAVYWPMHMDPFGEVTFHLSDKATGAFVRFLNFYVKRNGNVPFDEGKLCDRLRYKTVRSLRPVWDELCEAGVVAVTKGMVTCAFGDFILEKVRKARKQKVEAGEAGGAAKARAMAERKAGEAAQERSSGVPGEYNGNTAGIAAETDGTIQQNQWLDSDSASNLKPPNFKEKTPPTSPSFPPRKNGGGGGSEIQQIIAGFDSRIVDYWGEDARRAEPARGDAQIAGQWLAKAGGSVEAVLIAVDAEMEKERTNSSGPPGSLKAYCVSVPAKIANGPASRKTNGIGKAPSYAGTATTSEMPVWTEIRKLATDNWHDDVAREIQRRAREHGDEGANKFAEGMRGFVSTKKERAAA